MTRSLVRNLPLGHDETRRARRRASVVAAVAGISLVPWFWAMQNLASLPVTSPAATDPDESFLDYYVQNSSRLPWYATLFTVQWVIMLVLFVAVVRAVVTRYDVAAVVAVSLAAAAMAVYVVAEGVGVWPAVLGDRSEATIRAALDPGVARASVLSRDGLHAPAAVLLGVSVLLIGYLAVRSRLWGRWAIAALSLLSGVWALSSVVVGPEGLGPG